nr:immunoglobulin light chain junction region [Macaca mulatta]MOV74614.1 immunoglobulin light chain junction region [Macaca mulatta]MOV74967.1 immunoglobulin light chain junction region [Macaca mulatta]MOV75175.1 immunoglobulin light chain junction region [Macaca mulatta]MOV75283.1 immunoglobulin light chain junction region [Macaca mulatta]
CQQGYNIPWTF